MPKRVSPTMTLVNVAPFTVINEIRPTGHFRLPAPEPGERYAKLQFGDRVMKEPFGDDKYGTVHVPAEELAADLLRASEAEEMGVFVAEGDEPTDDELKKAEDKYYQWCVKQVYKGDVLWEKYKSPIWISEHHRVAARHLREKRVWVEDFAKRIACSNCGTPNLVTSAKCNCGVILDWDQARSLGILTDRQLETGEALGKFTIPTEISVSQELPEPKRPRGRPRKIVDPIEETV